MAKAIISKAPLTYVRLKGGSAVHVHKGGHVPASADPEDVKRLVKEGFLEEITLEEPETDSDDSGRPARVRDILAEVGDDPEKAAAALEAEKAGENRPTLVGKLEEIVAKASAGGDGGGGS